MLKPMIDGRYRTAASREQALCDWYGEDLAAAEIAAAKRPARAVQDLLRKAIRQVNTPEHQAMRDVTAQWRDIAGQAARWTRPGKIMNGVLLVEIWHPAMQFRLRGQEANILAAVRRVAPAVQGVRFVPGGSTPTFRRAS